MKNTRYSVTIGIPAYNEEANIGYLLREILSQHQEGYEITKIIVSSDGSTDKTKSIVEGFSKPFIEFIDNKDRQGQSVRQNQIIEKTATDILVLLNADITLTGTSFIKDLIAPIVNDTADLTSSDMLCLPPASFIEHVLATGFITRNEVFNAYNSGNNIYTCHGAARAFSKKLYQSFRFKGSIGEDGYSYLYCLKHKFRYQYANKAVAKVKLPNSLADHAKQSVRFLLSENECAQSFGKPFVSAHRKLPLWLVIRTSAASLLRHPIYAGCYALTLAAMIIQSKLTKTMSQTWEVSKSSKSLARDSQ